jgi:predicted DNA-binding protein
MASDTKPTKPTTFRLDQEQVDKLDAIRANVPLTRNGLVSLAVEAFLDFVERTGKLPVPKLRKGKRGGSDERRG